MKNIIKCFTNKMNKTICLFQTYGYENQALKSFEKQVLKPPLNYNIC